VRFLGRKPHCLLSVASAVTDLASAFAVLKRRNSTASLSAAFSHRNGSPLICLCAHHMEDLTR
jgi:hypothetical protein